MYGDLIERVRRPRADAAGGEDVARTAAAADVLHRPPDHQRVLEPCYDVGGDPFDYAVNGDTARLALFDAVGHGSAGGMRSVMLASSALDSHRNARRRGWT
jgi:hypothetical protein